jgi:hypothetical protein
MKKDSWETMAPAAGPTHLLLGYIKEYSKGRGNSFQMNNAHSKNSQRDNLGLAYVMV